MFFMPLDVFYHTFYEAHSFQDAYKFVPLQAVHAPIKAVTTSNQPLY